MSASSNPVHDGPEPGCGSQTGPAQTGWPHALWRRIWVRRPLLRGPAAALRRTRPGIALLLALAVVVVLTAFLSELFLDTGLETRAVANFRDSDQAQSLARSAYKALERALKTQSEQDFAFGYFRLAALMKLSGVPFESGLLTRMDVSSLDGLFDVNSLATIRPGTSQDLQRWAEFRNLVSSIPIAPEADGKVVPPITERQLAAYYGALVDWVDSDDVEYIALGIPGAERRDYTNSNPEYEIKNAPLDILEEMRLVRGYPDLNLPWSEVEKRFVVLPPSTSAQPGQELLDVNLAPREQIVQFLTDHRIDDAKVIEDATLGAAQKANNDLADEAEAIAAVIAPDGMDRPYFKDISTLLTALQAGGVSVQSGAITGGQLSQLFSTCSQNLRIRATVDVNGTKANLDAQIQVARGAGCAAATKVTLVRYTLR